MNNNQLIDSSVTVRNLLHKSGIQEILNKKGLTELAVNQPFRIWFDCGDGWEYKDEPACDFKICMELARAMSVYSQLSYALDFNHPSASVILPDGQRGQVLIPPACEADTVSFTLRTPSTTRFSLSDYSNSGRFSNVKGATKNSIQLSEIQKSLMALKESGNLDKFFELAVQSNLNILLVGGTGSGKTTAMKAFVDCYPPNKRMFTIEDVHELDLKHHLNYVHLFYRKGGMTATEIIEACMRMKPDHVLLAEIRGNEAWNYLEALNTGHACSVTTIHANNCYAAFSRLTSLVKQSPVGQTLDYDFIMKTVKSSIDVVGFFDHTYLTEIYYNPEEKNLLLSE